MTETTIAEGTSDAPAQHAGGGKPKKSRTSVRTKKAAEPVQKKREGKPGSPLQKSDHLLVGGEPRAHLLPSEVEGERHAAALRRRLGFGVIAVLTIVVVGVGAATVGATTAQTGLATEQAGTESLLGQELKYVKVRAVQDQVDLIQAAQQVGASTEIDWKDYLGRVQATLPGDVVITTVNVDSSTPIALYPQSTASLQGPRVATIAFTATSRSLPQLPVWLTALKTLPGYADALPSTVLLDPAGNYTVNITVHVNEKAFDKRFAKPGKK
jgi:hypothetical protein